jgi:hypothetical protein
MKYEPVSESNDIYTKWKTKQRITKEKYKDHLKTGVKKNVPLGKYQPIFNILKQQTLSRRSI